MSADRYFQVLLNITDNLTVIYSRLSVINIKLTKKGEENEKEKLFIKHCNYGICNCRFFNDI